MANFPRSQMDGVPQRPGFRRFFASDNEIDWYMNHNWETVKDEKVKNKHLRDQVVGSMHLIEIPEDQAKEFDRRFRGQEDHDRMIKSLMTKKVVRGEEGDDRGTVVGEEGVEVQTTELRPDKSRVSIKK